MTQSPTGAPKRCDLLIVHGCVLTMDAKRTVYADGAVAVSGKRIVAVGKSADIEAAWTADRRIDAAGGVVHPGFIDGHYHAGLHLSRGSITDNPNPPKEEGGGGPGVFTRWINAIDDEDEYASALCASAELVLNGFTGFVDASTSFSPDAVTEATNAVGIRISVSDCMLWDIVGGEPMAAEIPRTPCDAQRARRELGGQLKRNQDPDALARGHVAVYGLGSASVELMKEAKALADRSGTVFHQHQSLMKADSDYDRGRFGKAPLVYMAEAGIAGPNSVFTHMNILDDAEVEAIRSCGMALVWHPGNFMYYGISQTGRSAFPGLHKTGTGIAFGTDIAKAWPFGDLGFIAYLVSREWGEYLTSEAILEMFTLGGARAMGMEKELGSIEVGKRADIVVRRVDFPDAWPNVDVVRQLALVSRTKGVDT
ncbi:MAG: amidohydrolase family protein, partial [Rhizobiaceae bacterium]|nr:amidohydrolase family protein [Rhizobiaceae bacterium]